MVATGPGAAKRENMNSCNLEIKIKGHPLNLRYIAIFLANIATVPSVIHHQLLLKNWLLSSHPIYFVREVNMTLSQKGQSSTIPNLRGPWFSVLEKKSSKEFLSCIGRPPSRPTDWTILISFHSRNLKRLHVNTKSGYNPSGASEK